MSIDLAKILAKNLGRSGKPIGVKSCTLTLLTAGTRTAGAVSAGTNPTSTSYTAKGWIESYDARQIDGTIVQVNDRRISLLGASIASGAVPVPGATVTIVDGAGVEATYRVIAVTSDAVGAVYILQARK